MNFKDFTIIKETEKAYLLEKDYFQMWFPKSSISEDGSFVKYIEDKWNKGFNSGYIAPKTFKFSELKELCKFRMDLNRLFSGYSVSNLKLKNDWKREFRKNNRWGYSIIF